MAFLKEDIEKVLTKENLHFGHFLHHGALESANYSTIVAYLAGDKNAIHQVVQEHNPYKWALLLELIDVTDFTNPKNQLVFDILEHPNFQHQLKQQLDTWFAIKMLEYTEVGQFQYLKTRLQKRGLKENEIFELLTQKGISIDSLVTLEGTEVLHFMTTRMKAYQGPAVWYFHSGFFNSLNVLFFLLLDYIDTPYSRSLIKDGIDSLSLPAKWIAKINNGKYLSYVKDSLRPTATDHKELLQSKLNAALEIHETGDESIKEILLRLSDNYLDKYFTNENREWWEGGYRFADKSQYRYMTYSAIATSFLVEDNKNATLKRFEQFANNDIHIEFPSVEILVNALGSSTLQLFDRIISNSGKTRNVPYFKSILQILENKFNPKDYSPLLWKMLDSKTRSLKDAVTQLIAAKDPDAESKAIPLLKAKNADIRQSAAMILSKFNSESAKHAILAMLDSENNDNARDILVDALADSVYSDADEQFIQHTIAAAEKRKKLAVELPAMLGDINTYSIKYKDGNILNEKEFRFLMYRMSRTKEMRSDTEARLLTNRINKDESTEAALRMLEQYRTNNSPAESKWIMTTAALIANEKLIDKLRTLTNHWIESNRLKMAEYGIGALALQGSNKALRIVEWYSRKYKNKTASIGAAATLALENAAEELGISINELGDRIIPDFGFDGLFRHFKVDGDEYRAFIDSKFKIAFFDEDNKKLKAIPAAASPELKEEFKLLAKEIRDITKSQSLRLEHYLITQRRWTAEEWNRFFLQNPVMFIYATRILWGAYDDNQLLQETFICNEDTSLVNADQEEIDIPARRTIGIVHPSQLASTLLQQWKEFFFDNSIESIFPQLERKVPDISKYNPDVTVIRNFSDKRMRDGAIKSVLEKHGWRKGPTGDGGMLESMHLENDESKLEAVIELEGVGVGYGWGTEEKLGRLYVIDRKKYKHRYIGYIKDDSDDSLVKFSSLSKIFLIEMIAGLEAIPEYVEEKKTTEEC